LFCEELFYCENQRCYTLVQLHGIVYTAHRRRRRSTTVEQCCARLWNGT